MTNNRRPYAAGLVVLLVTLPLATVLRAETLDQAWQAALAADRRVLAAARLAQSAEESLAAARGARLPRLSLEGGYTWLNTAPAIIMDFPPFPPVQQPLGKDQYYNYRGTVNVPLYTSGRLARGVDAAQAGVSAARQDEASSVLDLKLRVGELYVAVLRTQRGVDVAEKHVQSLDAHAQDVANRFHQGLVAKNDLLAAQVALADARQRAIQAQSALDFARAGYNRQLGRALDAPVQLDELEPPAADGDAAALTARALKQRPELAGLQAQSAGLRDQAASERAASQPQLFLSGGYKYEENPYQLNPGIWSAMLGLRWDLFDGGIARHQAGAIIEKAEAAQQQHDDLASYIVLQVRQAMLNVGETRARVAVGRDALAQSEENLNVARSRYRAGLATNTVVLDAETQRIQAYTNYYDALYDAVLASLRLRYAVGDLLAGTPEAGRAATGGDLP
jgi:outer membrane protein